MAETIKDGHISEFTPDPQNARKHNPRNVGMIEKSLQTVGSGRSIVVDAEGTILAGNATIEAAAQAGIEDVIVIPTYGDKILVHQRLDIKPGDQRGVELALYDNRASDLSAWDTDMLAQLRAGTNGIDMDGLFTEGEWSDLFGAPRPDREPLDSSSKIGGLEYRVVVECKDEEAQSALIYELEGRGFTVKALIS